MKAWPDKDRAEFDKVVQDRMLEEVSALGYKEAYAEGQVSRVQAIVRAGYVTALTSARVDYLGKNPAASASNRKRKLAAAAGAPTARPKAAPQPT